MKAAHLLLMVKIFLVIPTLGQYSAPTGKNSCITCEELKNLKLPDVRISEAVKIEAGTSHCKVLGTIGKEINLNSCFLLFGMAVLLWEEVEVLWVVYRMQPGQVWIQGMPLQVLTQVIRLTG